MRCNVTVASLVVAVTIVGCSLTSGSDPARFYVLAPIEESGSVSAPESAAETGLLGIGPVVFPSYLDRPQMVTRIGPNQLEILEHDQWAEPLATGFARTLARDLETVLGTEGVMLAPWHPQYAPTYAVGVEVLRLDRDAVGMVVLQCRWTLTVTGTNERLIGRETTLTEPAATPDVAGSVAAMSRVIGTLSREIAEAVAAAGR